MGKGKSLLHSIEDESTLFLNKTPDELLKELQKQNSKVKDLKLLSRNKSQALEKQIQKLIGETTKDDKYESGDDEKENDRTAGQEDEDREEEEDDEDKDLDLSDMDPMEQLKMLENPVEDEFEEEGSDFQDEDPDFDQNDEIKEVREKGIQEIDEKENLKKKPLLLSEDELDSDEAELEKTLSSYQRERQKILSQARQLEEENVQEAAWTMKGEISSRARPENSLLEEDLEFDFQSVPPPVITETISESIEDIIKRRILERAFDNPKVPITQEVKDEAILFKQRKQKYELEMQERNDLGKIYEQDFLKSKGELSEEHTLDPKLKAKYKEVKELYDKISTTMDALLYKSKNFLIRY